MSDFIPQTPPLFQTSLAFPLAPTDPTFTIADDVMINGVPLVGLVCCSVDIGQPNPEYILGTLLNDVVTVIARNITPLDPTVAGSVPTQTHRRGAVVKITDFASIQMMRNLLNGTTSFKNILSYFSSQNFTGALQIVDKEYVDNQSQSGFIFPNIGTPVKGNTGAIQVTTKTIAVTTANNNRFLYAKFSMESSQTITPAPTYNAVNMTLLGAQNQGNTRVEVWGIVAPTLGTHNLIVNFSGLTLLEWDIIPFDSVDQTTPYVTGTTNGGTSVTSSGTVTTLNPNALSIHSLSTKLIGVSYAAGVGETIISSDVLGSVQGAIEVKNIATPSLVTSSISISPSTDWANVIGAINGLQPSGSTYLKIDGTNSMAADLDFGSNKGKNLANASNPQDAVTFAQLQAAVIAGGVPATNSQGGYVKVATNVEFNATQDTTVVGPFTFFNMGTLTQIKNQVIALIASALSSSSFKKVGVGETSDIQWFNIQYPFNFNTTTPAQSYMWDLGAGVIFESPSQVAFPSQGTLFVNAVSNDRLLPNLDDAGGNLKFSSGKQIIFQQVIRSFNTGVNAFECGLGFESFGGNGIQQSQGTNVLSIGFVRKASDGTWYARAATGVAFTETLIVVSNGKHTMRCEYDPANATPQARYYVDGILVATINTTIPTANASIVGFSCGNSNTGAATTGIVFAAAPSFAVEI